MQIRRLMPLLALLVTLLSCSSHLKKYESNWVVVACEVDGEDFIGELFQLNFKINVKSMSSSPPSLANKTIEDRRTSTCDIRFFRKDSKDYMEVLEHRYFSGTYEIKCLDEGCCKIMLQSNRIKMELDYNGDLPFGGTRNCPKARF